MDNLVEFPRKRRRAPSKQPDWTWESVVAVGFDTNGEFRVFKNGVDATEAYVLLSTGRNVMHHSAIHEMCDPAPSGDGAE